jgi:hypothetical protein
VAVVIAVARIETIAITIISIRENLFLITQRCAPTCNSSFDVRTSKMLKRSYAIPSKTRKSRTQSPRQHFNSSKQCGGDRARDRDHGDRGRGFWCLSSRKVVTKIDPVGQSHLLVYGRLGVGVTLIK